MNLLFTLSVLGEVFVWDREKGVLIYQYAIEFGTLNENSRIYLQKKIVFSFGFKGDFFGSKFLKRSIHKFENGHSDLV